MGETQVIRDDEKHEYELRVDGVRAGFAQFRARPGRILFIHTVIDEAFGGQGLGSILAQAAIEDAIARGETIVPYCPFIAAYLREHTQYEDHVEWPVIHSAAEDRGAGTGSEAR